MTQLQKKPSYKLIFVCHEYPPIGGGAATALQNLAKNLACEGQDVTILTIGPITPVIYESTTNLSIVSLGNVRKNPLCPSFIEFVRSYFLLKFKAPLHIAQLEPDVVISFFAFPAGKALAPYLKKKGIPHVVSIRGVDAPGFQEERLGGIIQYFLPYLVKSVLYSASAVYGNGKRLKDLVERYFKGIKVVNIPNGVNLDSNLKVTQKDFSTYNLIFVGQLIERKRITEALEGVINFAKHTTKKINFTIVGSGILETKLKKAAKRTPPNLRIIFYGYIGREELSQLYNQQHVMIHLSQDEGVSNTLLEAFSKGLAILASKDATYEFSQKEALFPGTVIYSFSPNVIGNSLAELFANKDALCQNFSKSRELAKEFSWKKNSHKILEIVEAILGKSARY